MAKATAIIQDRMATSSNIALPDAAYRERRYGECAPARP
jgi:hypothetical protein